MFERIDVVDAKKRMDGGWDPFVLDVRGEGEAATVSFDFVDLLVPHTQVPGALAKIPTDRDILVHCRSGGRSAVACQILASVGYTRLWNLEGGINGWATQVDPSMPTY